MKERRRGLPVEELGFTLIELLIVITILPLVIGGVTIAVITTMNDQAGLQSKLGDSHDAQFTANTFDRDIQSAALITTNPSSTPLCGTGTQVLGLEWQPTPNTTTIVSYVTTSKPEVVRDFCTTGAAVSSTTVSFDVSTASGPPTATACNSYTYTPPVPPSSVCQPPTSASPPPLCNPFSPGSSFVPNFCLASVVLQIGEQSGFSYTLTASPRQEAGSGGYPPNGSTPSLLVLGSGANVVQCGGSGHGGPLNVNGIAAVDSSSPGSLGMAGSSTIAASEVYSGDPATSGSSAPVQPPSAYSSTTTQPYASGAPVPDPYFDLPDPPTSGPGITQYTTPPAGGLLPGVYLNSVTITNSQTLPTGVYVFEQGLSIAGNTGTTVSSAPGGVLIFIGMPNAPFSPAQTAAYTVSGNGTVNFSALSPLTYPNNPYATDNVVLFQSRTDSAPMAISGNGSTATYNGVVYAKGASVSTSGNGATTSGGIVAQTLTCGGNAAVTIGPAPTPTATTLVSSQNSPVSGQSVTFTATVSPSPPTGFTPTGSVTFTATPNGSSTASTLCSNVALNNGVATCATSALTGAGSPYSVTATYGGNISFASSSNTPPLSQTVNPAGTSTSVVTSGTPSTLNQAVTYTATVGVIARGSGPADGSVEFIDNGTPIAACGGASGVALNGLTPDQATCIVTTYTAGAIHTINAQYLGTGNFSSSSATVLQSVGPQLSNFKEKNVSPPSTHQETFSGNTNENTGTVTVYVCLGTLASCSSGSAVKTYSITTFTGSSPSFAWSVTTNSNDLTPSTAYTATVSQVDSSAQPSVNSQTVTFTT